MGAGRPAIDARSRSEGSAGRPRARASPRRGPALPRLLAALFLAALAGAAAELALRELWPPARRAYVWPPGLETVHEPDPALLPGVSGTARLSIGSHGLRAGELDARDALRIAAVGGSTTECLFLDEDETWCALLARALERRLSVARVWVGNAGRSGHTTREHRVQVEHVLEHVPGLDAVIVLAGINDLGRRLARDEGFEPLTVVDGAARLELRRAAFVLLPLGEDPDGPLADRFALARALKVAKDRALAGRARDDAFDVGLYRFWRANRAAATTRRERLPDLAGALAEFRANLAHAARLARGRGVALVLATQPSLYRAGLAPEIEARLWMGGVGAFQHRAGAEYYATAALAEGLAAYAREVRELCAREGIPCVDLAAELGGDPTFFYDDVHFTEEGARAAARALEGPLAELARARAR